MRWRWIAPLAVAVLTATGFAPAVTGSFLNWDDNVNFLENLSYRGLGASQVRWAFTSTLFGHYIPLTRLSWCINYALGGLNPAGYHLVNVLLHAGNAVLFFFVVRRLLAAATAGDGQEGRRALEISAAAAVAALVFGLHPLRVEPVAWISGRADVLCGTFALLATWAYLKAVEANGPARPGLVLAAAAGLAAAILSKGSALPLPAALLLLDVYPLRRLHRLGAWTLVREKLPLLLVALAGTLTVALALRHGAVLTGSRDYGLLARVTVAAYSFVVYPLRFVWPSSLSPLYEMPARVSPFEVKFGLGLLACVVVTALLVGLRRRWPAGLAAWTFSALLLAPTSAAIRLGADLAPDRYSYLSGLSLAALAGGGALAVIRLVQSGRLSRVPGRMAALAALVVVAGFGVTSWSFADVWRQSETLWRWAVEVDPTCSICHGKLGESVLEGSSGPARLVEAEQLFRRAIALRPDLPDAYFNLGTTLVVQGRYAEAEEPLRIYMERVPQAPAGPERLGLLYALEHRYETAVPLLREALARKGDTPALRGYLVEALRGRARELSAEGNATEADQLLAEASSLEGR
jgi:hypothetical protein